MIVAKHAEFLNSETVYELLKSADTFSAKPLKRQCAAVAHGNLQEFISQKACEHNLKHFNSHFYLFLTTFFHRKKHRT